jgi:hypothetical protein
LERKSRITFRQDQGVQTLLITNGVTGKVYKRNSLVAKKHWLIHRYSNGPSITTIHLVINVFLHYKKNRNECRKYFLGVNAAGA